MFLTGTILNVVTVLLGTLIGVLLGSRMPARIQSTLTDGLGVFTLLLGVSMGIRVRVASFLPALVLAPLFQRHADAIRGALA